MLFAAGWLTIWLLLTSSPGAAPAPVEIPFEFAGHHTFIDVRLKGKTLSFVFDTGAAGVALNERTARHLGIEPSSYGTATGAAGSLRIGMARGLRMQVGALRLKDVSAAVLPLVHLEEYIGRPLDGIIGRDVMRGRVVLLDHDRNVIRIHARKDFPFDAWGTPCRLDRSALPTVEGDIELLDGTKLSGKLLVDTGAGLYLSLNSPFARKHKLPDRVGGTYPRTGRALTGIAIKDTMGQVAAVGFCGHRFPLAGADRGRIPVGLSGATEGVQAGTSEAGLVGNGLLRRFNIAFDIGANRMFLKPNDGWDAPIRSDASGLLLKRHADGAVRVVEVLEGSPGAEAGLEEGDRIIAVDEVTPEVSGLPALRQRLMIPGRSFQFEIERDSGRKQLELRSRSLFSPSAAAATGSAPGSPSTSPARSH